MSVRVSIPTPLRRFTQSRDSVAAEGASVAEVLAFLRQHYPELSARIVDESGNLRRFIALRANGQDVRALDGLNTALGDGDALSIASMLAV